MKRIVTSTSILVVALLALTAVTAAKASESALMLDEAIHRYHRIQASLADDSVTGVVADAAAIVEAVAPCACSADEKSLFLALGDAARKMTGSDLAELREQFEELSRAIGELLVAEGIATAQLYYCPMVDAFWVQRAADSAVRNPYLGKAMSKCGTRVDHIEG